MIEISEKRGVPLTLVNQAVSSGRITDGDEVWCVFDVESPRNHPNLKQAIQKAGSNDIHLAISNPCFEVWLIMHLQDIDAYGSTEEIERRSRKLENRADKNIDAAFYMDNIADAVGRAKRLESRHHKAGTPFPQDNPSSSMYKLIEAMGVTAP